MRSWMMCAVLTVVAATTGCAETYRVNFVNNAPLATDFRIDEAGIDNDTFVLAVAPNGGTASVVHDGRKSNVTIASGIAAGQQLVVIDATCEAEVFEDAIVDVVKHEDGSLTCTVRPGFPASTFVESAIDSVKSAIPSNGSSSRTPRR